MLDEGVNDLVSRIALDIQSGPHAHEFKSLPNLNMEVAEALTSIYNHEAGHTPEREAFIDAVMETEAYKLRNSYPNMHENFPEG